MHIYSKNGTSFNTSLCFSSISDYFCTVMASFSALVFCFMPLFDSFYREIHSVQHYVWFFLHLILVVIYVCNISSIIHYLQFTNFNLRVCTALVLTNGLQDSFPHLSYQYMWQWAANIITLGVINYHIPIIGSHCCKFIIFHKRLSISLPTLCGGLNSWFSIQMTHQSPEALWGNLATWIWIYIDSCNGLVPSGHV